MLQSEGNFCRGSNQSRELMVILIRFFIVSIFGGDAERNYFNTRFSHSKMLAIARMRSMLLCSGRFMDYSDSHSPCLRKRKIHHLWPFVTILICWPPNFLQLVLATTYYVDTVIGSDSNPGSAGPGTDTLDGYRLQPGSPCIDSGRSIPNNGSLDLWGNPVPDPVGVCDRGAHEYPGPKAVFVDRQERHTMVSRFRK